MAYDVDKRGGLERSQHIRANRPRVERAQRAVQWQGINCPSGRAIAPEFSRGANAIIGCLFCQDNYDGIMGGIVGGRETGGIIWKHVCTGVDVRVLWASTLVLWSRTLFERERPLVGNWSPHKYGRAGEERRVGKLVSRQRSVY